MTITRCYAINRDIDGDLSGEYVPFCQTGTAQLSGDVKKERLKALLMKKYCEGGSEYSKIFIFIIEYSKIFIF